MPTPRTATNRYGLTEREIKALRSFIASYGKPWRTVAKHCGMGESTVRKHFTSGIRKLKHHFNENGFIELPEILENCVAD